MFLLLLLSSCVLSYFVWTKYINKPISLAEVLSNKCTNIPKRIKEEIAKNPLDITYNKASNTITVNGLKVKDLSTLNKEAIGISAICCNVSLHI